MQPTERDLWTLNFYRNSELHGALLMGRLARTLGDSTLLGHATRHCATEAHHAAMLTGAIEALNGTIDPRVPTVQEHYSARGGVPSSIVDVLVLSEVLEKRVLATYRAHVARSDVHPQIKQTLTEILAEMEEEDHGEEGSWIEAALDQHPKSVVEAAEKKWRAVDAAAVSELATMADAKFASGGAA
ncbi:MAG TPA: ferritin-like domain-containing protein [Gemmatimonadaceae bacterium]|nr:ferritin-like domain-containing protein [Gemmatimonadaceae bacterium]